MTDLDAAASSSSADAAATAAAAASAATATGSVPKQFRVPRFPKNLSDSQLLKRESLAKHFSDMISNMRKSDRSLLLLPSAYILSRKMMVLILNAGERCREEKGKVYLNKLLKHLGEETYLEQIFNCIEDFYTNWNASSASLSTVPIVAESSNSLKLQAGISANDSKKNKLIEMANKDHEDRQIKKTNSSSAKRKVKDKDPVLANLTSTSYKYGGLEDSLQQINIWNHKNPGFKYDVTEDMKKNVSALMTNFTAYVLSKTPEQPFKRQNISRK